MVVTSIVTAGRRLVDSTLLDHCRLLDRVRVKDASGGTSDTWTTRAAPTRCRFVRMVDDQVGAALESVFGRATAVLLLPVGTVFTEGTKARNLADSKVWIIVGRISPPSALITVERVAIREIER